MSETMAQQRRGGVVEGVQVAGLEGHVSRDAVYLIHKEAWRWRLNRRPGGYVVKAAAGRLSLRSGCYHTRTVNVL